MNGFTRSALIALVAAMLAQSAMAGDPVTTAFSYQGQLRQGSGVVDGTADIRFGLWNAGVGGSLVAGTIQVNNLVVNDGVFTALVDFGGGAGVFGAAQRWLEIAVRVPHDPGNTQPFVTLSPRQMVTPTPVAQFALSGNEGPAGPPGPPGDSHWLLNGSHTYYSDGNVGIGSAAPTAALHVVGTVRLEHDGSGKSALLSVSDSVSFPGEAILSSETLTLATTIVGGGGSSRRVVIRNNGRVGIGTTAPSAPLHVQFSQPNGALARLHNSVDERALLSFMTGFREWSIGQNRPEPGFPDVFFIRDETANATRLAILANGNVGIGTLAPGTFLLAVNGTAAKPGGGSWSLFSDARLKRDIEPIAPGMLDRLLWLHGYTFEYEPEAIEHRLALPGRQTGLLAHEVQQVFPDWVEADDDGYLYITERGTTAMFIEALREMRAEKDAQIAAQTAALETLRAEKDAQIQSLNRDVVELRAMVQQLLDRKP